MRDVNNDISKTVDLFFYSQSDCYQPMFFSSNENLDELFSNIDIKDKEVLTVLGSGDHAFNFLSRGAKAVDVFDKNKLTFYYFYLRMWIMKYYNTYYPTIPMSKDYILKLLSIINIKNEDEEAAVLYWEGVCKHYGIWDFFELFQYCNDELLKNQVDDLNSLIKIINNYEFNYYDVDITKKVNIPKKYDIICTSNIAEWIEMKGHSYNQYMLNLDKSLKKDGIILSSHLIPGQNSIREKDVFSSSFLYKELPKTNEDDRISFGYTYVRK